MTASRPPDVDALARRLSRREPPPERSAALRHALLEAAGAPQARRPHAPLRRWVIGAGVAVAAVACVGLALRALAPAHHDAPAVASVPAAAATTGAPAAGAPTRTADPPRPPGASTAATIASPAAGDPIPDGRSAIHATRPLQLARGDTRITAPPGAQFDVEVQGDQVRLVTVRSGWVVVADAHSAATVIVERETWFPTEPAASGTASSGTASSGTASSGTASSGTASSGTASSGTGSAGTPARGSPPTGAPPGASSGSRPPGAPAYPAPSIAASPSPDHAADRAAPPAAAPPAATPPAATLLTAADPNAQAAAAEQAFHDGLRALLAGKARDATGPLDRACGMSSTSQDDICYWAAIAWLRAGDRPQARRALTDVLTHHPGSTHAGEASVALGWLLLDAGDRAAARARFSAAINDRMPDVRAQAARGLAAAQ